MSRYIDTDEAIKVMACEMYAEAQSQGYDVDGIEDFIPEATAWMNDAPSIDIVRCKECKHWIGETEYYEDREYKACWQLCGQYMNSDFWCKYGERREP